jgi:membrane glycosyltransferase
MATSFYRDPTATRLRIPCPQWRRLIFFFLVGSLTGYGVGRMWDILRANGLQPLELGLLLLFAVNFLWIAWAFCSAMVGFVLRILGRDPLSLDRQCAPGTARDPLVTRTALVMPAYNEDTRRVGPGRS